MINDADYTDKVVERLERKFRKIYGEAEKTIQKKMNDLVKANKAEEKVWEAKVKDGTATQKQFDEWKRTQVFAGKSWETQQKNIVEALSRANTLATSIVHDGQMDVFKYSSNFVAREIEHGFGASFGFDIYDEKTIMRLIRDDPKILPFKKLDKVKDARWNFKNIKSQVAQGIMSGDSIPKIAQRLANVVPDRNAKQMTLHARTAMTSAHNGGRMERYKEAEELGIKLKKVWIATLDDRTRDLHKELDGVEVEPDEPFEIDGYEIMYPGDPYADPSMTYNCRCTLGTKLLDYPAEFDRRGKDENGEYEIVDDSRKGVDSVESAYEQVGQYPTRPKKGDYDDYDEYLNAREQYKAEKAEWEEKAGAWYDDNVDQNPMSIDDFKEWCKDKGWVTADGSLEGLDGIALRNYTERFEQLSNDFPIVKESWDKIGAQFRISYDPNGMFGADAAGGMKFGGTFRDYRQTVMLNTKNVCDGIGITVRGESPAVSIFDHEWGHQVQMSMKTMMKADPFDSTKEELSRILEMENDLRNSVYGKAGMSEYATTNEDELFAEGFCAWYGGEKTEFANAFGEFLKRWLKP